MFPFSHDLGVGADPHNGRTVIGFSHNGMFITDPTQSSCGRFQVDPAQYGLKPGEAEALANLNEEVRKAADEALNAACYSIQTHLGVETGDFAGVYFSGEGEKVVEIFAYYAVNEVNFDRANREETHD